MLSIRTALHKCRSPRGTVSRPSKRSLCSKAAWKEDTVDLNSVVTPFSGQSPNKLKNMIFCHGLFGSGSNWRAIASGVQSKVRTFCSSNSRLPDNRKLTSMQTLLNTHLLDARNHGLSPHTTEMNFDLMAEDLFRYIVKNDLGRCVLLGHSMGGRTVMTFASKYPELVEKLIVVDVSPVTYGLKHYDYHLNLMRDLKKLDLDKIRTRKEAEAEASKYIDVRPSMSLKMVLFCSQELFHPCSFLR